MIYSEKQIECGKFIPIANTTLDAKKIANKEFEYEDLKFIFKRASDMHDLQKKWQKLYDSLAKQNNGLEYNCRCGNTSPTIALAGDLVDLRCTGCNKMFHQKCLSCIIIFHPLPGKY